jgi:hypothetical protein
MVGAAPFFVSTGRTLPPSPSMTSTTAVSPSRSEETLTERARRISPSSGNSAPPAGWSTDRWA